MIIALGWLALAWAGGDALPAAKPSPVPVAAEKKSADAPEPQAIWQLTLKDAITLGLSNSESIRVLSVGSRRFVVGCRWSIPRVDFESDPDRDCSQVVICQLDAGLTPWQFKAEVMALVRLIEQQYWSLSQQQQELWARQKAVELTRAVLEREQKELQVGHRSLANLAEVDLRLERYNRDLAARTSDVARAERRLRNLLELPPVDSRRIVAVTAPTIEKYDLHWEECLASMNARQPELVQQAERARWLERFSKNVGRTLARSATPVAHDLLAFVERRLTTEPTRQQKLLQDVKHRTTYMLARLFLEVDANYKSLQAATGKKQDAEHRVETTCEHCQEGRLPVDRYFDAISLYLVAAAEKARARSAYNDSLTALEEAKGTLLATRGVEVRDPPRKVRIAKRDEAINPVSIQPSTAPAHPRQGNP